jgi:opacity protein-like surface antigen
VRPRLLACLAALLLGAPIARSAEPLGSVDLVLGQKWLDADDWDPVDEHVEVGVSTSWRKHSWPIAIAADLVRSEDDATLEQVIDVRGETWELALGARKRWGRGRTHPLAGGGLALVRAEYEVQSLGESVEDSDDGTGFWLEGGVVWDLPRGLEIGLDLRYSRAEVTIGGENGEAGGAHLALLFGWHFPSP